MKPCLAFLANISSAHVSVSARCFCGAFFDLRCAFHAISFCFDRYSAVFRLSRSNLSLQIFFHSRFLSREINAVLKYIRHFVDYYCRILLCSIHYELFARFSFFRNCVLRTRVVYCMKIMGWNFSNFKIPPNSAFFSQRIVLPPALLLKGEHKERLNQKRG